MIKICNTLEGQSYDNLVIPFYEKTLLSDLIFQYYGRDIQTSFEGTQKEIFFLPKLSGQTIQIILFGLGDSAKQEKISTLFRYLFHQKYKQLKGRTIILTDHLQDYHNRLLTDIVQGISTSSYSCGLYKESWNERETAFADLEVLLLSTSASAAQQLKTGLITAESLMNSMHLVDLPSNIKTPDFIAKYAQESAVQNGFSAKVVANDQLIENKLYALAAVGQGSVNKPCLIEMEYTPTTKGNYKKIAFVGKGITFDTGGISIKGSANMHFMKSDMGGAAAVIGAIELIAKMELPIHAIGIVPTAENMVDGNSIRPGDVIQSHSGKTIEVIDTDAEGRLILADGLSYAISKFRPDIIIDIATLTGSAVATLGGAAAAFMCQDEIFAQKIYHIGHTSGDKVWRLPLWEEYGEMMQSDIADIKNLATRPVAGAITAAKFLETFTSGHPQWAHIDIAGVCFTESEFSKSRSANGFGVKLLTEIAKHFSSIV